MKLKFKIQPYQTAAVESVLDCFTGQLKISGMSYRIDPGSTMLNELGVRNSALNISEEDLLALQLQF